MAKPAEPVFELSGGALALDFANSIEKRPLPQPLELLHGYSDLIAWAAQARLIDRGQAERLRAVARRRATDAERVFERAIRLREAIFAAFSAIAGTGGQVDPSHLELIRVEALAAYQHARLARQSGVFRWEFGDTDALDSVLWPIAHDAVALLADSASLRAVRECASDRCAWLFLDRSRNRSRRWCDMKVCGNRAKSRRHYRRARQTATA